MPSKKVKVDKSAYAWALTRISIGFVFLWAFFDKLFGLGFATCRNPQTDVVTTMCDKAWINGGSPTNGFLKFGTKGPFADFFQSLAGNSFIDWLFMIGLLCIGIALVTGIAMKLAAISASILLFLMWLAALWPDNNPVVDDHIVYIFVLMGLGLSSEKQVWSLKGWWDKTSISKSLSFLK